MVYRAEIDEDILPHLREYARAHRTNATAVVNTLVYNLVHGIRQERPAPVVPKPPKVYASDRKEAAEQTRKRKALVDYLKATWTKVEYSPFFFLFFEPSLNWVTRQNFAELFPKEDIELYFEPNSDEISKRAIEEDYDTAYTAYKYRVVADNKRNGSTDEIAERNFNVTMWCVRRDRKQGEFAPKQAPRVSDATLQAAGLTQADIPRLSTSELEWLRNVDIDAGTTPT